MRLTTGRLLLLFIFFAAAAGCGKPPAPKHVGILLHGESRIPLMNGFLEEMKTLGYDEGKNLIVTTLNTDNDQKLLKPMTQQLIEKKPDLLVAAGGLEADEMKVQLEQLPPPAQTPLLVLYINAIFERKFVADRRNPGWNVTGVDNLNGELSGKRIELLSELVPGAKRILILYHPKIEPSYIGLNHAREAAGKLGLEIVDRAVAKPEEITQAMEALKPGDVDAMLLVPTAPIDNQLKDVLLPQAERLKIPVMTHTRSMLKPGATASYGAPFADLGKQGARLADKILRGTAARDIPFEVPTKYEYSVNRPALAKLGLDLSEAARRQVTEVIE